MERSEIQGCLVAHENPDCAATIRASLLFFMVVVAFVMVVVGGPSLE
jgi:hypothetical protein